MKKNSMLVVFLTLIAFVLFVSGCGKSGGGSKGPSSKDEDISNQSEQDSMFFELTEFSVEESAPSYVNILFHVMDSNGTPVTSLSTEDFEVLEDDESIQLTESSMQIKVEGEVEYKLYTVIMIDNSMSIGPNLADIKAAAKAYIMAAADTDSGETTGRQYFKIYSFSESFDDLMPDCEPPCTSFSNDISVINNAIDSIQAEQALNSTNLYGSIIEGVENWTDAVVGDAAEQGHLLLLTDGTHTYGGTLTLNDALYARGYKKVITVGIGDAIDTDILEQLGNAGFYTINDVDELADDELADELTQRFIEIQTEIDLFANTFYSLKYLSPKIDQLSHKLTLKVKENTNTNDNAEIHSDFSSLFFWGVHKGIYIDDSNIIPSEKSIINVARDSSNEVLFNIYFGALLSPQYSIIANNCDSDIMTMGPALDTPSKYIISAAAVDDVCNVEVYDSANDFNKLIEIIISETGIPTNGLIAYYAFDNNLNDDSGNENTATNNGLSFTQDRAGNENSALLIDAKTDYSTISDISNSTISISMWYYHTDNVFYLNDYVLLSSDNAMYQQHLVVDKQSRRIGFNNDGLVLSDFQLSLNTWYHIVLIKKDTYSKLYIDNNLVQESYENFNNASYPLSVIGNGRVKYDSAMGRIDDLRIYDYILPETEISNLFHEN